MEKSARGTVYDFLGDRLVYRNLDPLHPGLPSLDDLRAALDLPEGKIPRKSEPAYARVIVAMLTAARTQSAPGVQIRRLVFVGDTRLNDGTAFANLCQALDTPGWAFIGSEDAGPPTVEVETFAADRALYLANRWASLEAFDDHLAGAGFTVDESTAVIVDLDKTALGARGRNAQVIDRARVAAVRQTVAAMLGESFDQESFQRAYDRLNQVSFHPFTRDNQDYLAYLSLILGAGLVRLEALVEDVQIGRLARFEDFIEIIETRAAELPSGLQDVHARIYKLVAAGDPTPFKAFRRQEFRTTVSAMGHLPDDAPVGQLLEEEILLTREVQTLANRWGERGALLFGLSDKPDEASIPTPELAGQGYQPIHRTPTHVVGEVP